MPPTQIGRALQELGIAWIPAHSPQAKGRVERNFGTAQDRLVKGMRAGVKTLEQANHYLEESYLTWWERELTVDPAHSDDAHRPLDKSHSLGASLSHVEMRQVRNDYTIPLDAEIYQIERQAAVSGLRKAKVRVEKRLDGSIAVRFGERLIVATSSGRLILNGLLASIARLRFTGTRNLTRNLTSKGKRGHFYFCLDKCPISS